MKGGKSVRKRGNPPDARLIADHDHGSAVSRLGLVDGAEFRKGKSPDLSTRAGGTEYAQGLLKVIVADPDWTVLDIGGASGDMAIPLARKVKSVIVAGFSHRSTDLARRYCLEQGITNLSFLPNEGKDHEWDRIDECDVVVASGAALYQDLPGMIVGLDERARRKIVVSATVGDGPFDRRIYEAAGRKLDMGPSYTSLYYDVIHKYLGILANIVFVSEKKSDGWANREEALEAQKWMFEDLTLREEERIRRFLDDHLVRTEGIWRLPYEGESKWAIMWWEKKKEQIRTGRSKRCGYSAGSRMRRKNNASVE
jgi:hypothetical protein